MGDEYPEVPTILVQPGVSPHQGILSQFEKISCLGPNQTHSRSGWVHSVANLFIFSPMQLYSLCSVFVTWMFMDRHVNHLQKLWDTMRCNLQNKRIHPKLRDFHFFHCAMRICMTDIYKQYILAKWLRMDTWYTPNYRRSIWKLMMPKWTHHFPHSNCYAYPFYSPAWEHWASRTRTWELQALAQGRRILAGQISKGPGLNPKPGAFLQKRWYLGFLLGSFERFQKHTYEFIPTNMGICLYILYIYIYIVLRMGQSCDVHM